MRILRQRATSFRLLVPALTMAAASCGLDHERATTVTLTTGDNSAAFALELIGYTTTSACVSDDDCMDPPEPTCENDVLVTHGYPGKCNADNLCEYEKAETTCSSCVTSEKCLQACAPTNDDDEIEPIICDPVVTGGCATVGFCTMRGACDYYGPAGHVGLPCNDGDGCTTGETCCEPGVDENCWYIDCHGGTAMDAGLSCENEDGKCELVSEVATCVGYCGDGYADSTDGEACDYGNTNRDDGCSIDCKTIEAGWECNESIPTTCEFLVNYGCRDDACASDTLYECTAATPSVCYPDCGDGLVRGEEVCDDGGVSGGCNADCTAVMFGWTCVDDKDDKLGYCYTVCGDGKTAGTEECDDDNTVNNDNCTNQCTAAACGDGIAATAATGSAYEACDDGNSVNNDNCTNQCTAAACGDRIAATAATGSAYEACDDGNTTDDCTCLADCQLPSCGDGLVCGAEECDDANTNDHDNCRDSCVVANCGDGVAAVDATGDLFEECDDGDSDKYDDCKTDCTWAWCGDEIAARNAVERYEYCDDGELNGSYGHCNALCRDIQAYCGDGTCDPEESGSCGTCPADCSGMACPDDLYCTVGETCQADGSCGGGSAKNCNEYGSWGSCGGWSSTCDESGTRTRTVYIYDCYESSDRCAYTGTTSTQTGTCSRDTDGTSCAGGGTCMGGFCKNSL